MGKQKEKLETSHRYDEEHRRLEDIVRDSEKIWEDRTFGIAAGGLSLSFAMFSFLVGQGVVRSITVCMLLIWLGYVACLTLNYWSHRESIRICRQLQQDLCEDRHKGLPYDDTRLKARYSGGNKKMEWINYITEGLLIASVLSTLFYTFCISLR